MFAFRGSTAMITGASKGLGVAFAKGLAGRGINLVLVARSINALQDLADSLGRRPDSHQRRVVEITEHRLDALRLDASGLVRSPGSIEACCALPSCWHASANALTLSWHGVHQGEPDRVNRGGSAVTPNIVAAST